MVRPRLQVRTSNKRSQPIHCWTNPLLTLLPECVATYTRRPLYPITCGRSKLEEAIISFSHVLTSPGDIGYLPEQVEANMEQHFKLAHKWGCVLLLDEADVFLAKRDVRTTLSQRLLIVHANFDDIESRRQAKWACVRYASSSTTTL